MKSGEKNLSFFRKVIASKTLSYLLILLSIFGLVSLSREISHRISLKKRLAGVETQVQNVETENDELLNKTRQMQTEYFRERAARLKLGLQKPGERVIVIVPTDDTPAQSESKSKYFGKKISNFKSWWEYFTNSKIKNKNDPMSDPDGSGTR